MENKTFYWAVHPQKAISTEVDWLSSVLRPLQHSIGYMGDGFYRSKDPTNSIKVLKEKAVKENNTKNTKKTQITDACTHKIVDKYSKHE